MSTPHNSAEAGAFAKTVLMPGDPMRAKFIAETFLEDAVLVNNIRGVQGYTGTYKGKKISVMASGMGMPSMGIYSYELFHNYDVDNIIRIGSAGSLSEELPLRSVVIAMSASYQSNYAEQFELKGTYAPTASYKLLKRATDTAENLGLDVHVGNVLSSDYFYDDSNSSMDWKKMGVLAVEMESAALYMNAARAGKHALGIFTVSDNLATGAKCTAQERQTTFTTMMELALELAE